MRTKAVDLRLGAADSSTPSDGGTVSIADDHSLTLTLTRMSQYGSENALGPGAGDRIVYMSNVKVVWMAVNGEVGIHIPGFDGIGANAVKDRKGTGTSAGDVFQVSFDVATDDKHTTTNSHTTSGLIGAGGVLTSVMTREQ